MKKNKLLIPFLSLAVLPGTMIPFASCSKPSEQIVITFQPTEGGTIIGPTTLNVEPGAKWVDIVKPNYDFNIGYTFIGWFNNNREMQNDDIISSSMTIIAKFDILPTTSAENFEFEITTNRTARIDRLTEQGKALTKIAIPSKYVKDGNEYTVNCIDEDVFLNNHNLIQLVIPDSVTSIFADAFGGTDELVYLAIGSGLANIEENAFYDCSKLSSIKVNTHNRIFNDGNNSNCIINKITNVLVLGCKNTVIPNGVITIGGESFSECIGLKQIDIPNSVQNIESYAFAGCTNLEHITIPDSVNIIDNCAFKNCESLTSVLLGSGINRIGVQSFAGCKNLTTITIPSNVSKIQMQIFSNCSNLKEIDVSQFDDVPENWSPNETFENIASEGTIYVKDGLQDSWKQYFTQSSGSPGIDWTKWIIKTK